VPDEYHINIIRLQLTSPNEVSSWALRWRYLFLLFTEINRFFIVSNRILQMKLSNLSYRIYILIFNVFLALFVQFNVIFFLAKLISLVRSKLNKFRLLNVSFLFVTIKNEMKYLYYYANSIIPFNKRKYNLKQMHFNYFKFLNIIKISIDFS